MRTTVLTVLTIYSWRALKWQDAAIITGVAVLAWAVPAIWPHIKNAFGGTKAR